MADAVRQEGAQELDRLIARVFPAGPGGRPLDLEATEMAVRAAMHRGGGGLLAQLVNARLRGRGL